MRFQLILVAGAMLAVLGILAVRSEAGPSPIGRYQITGTEARVWRVDTVTGQLRTCFQAKINRERTFRCVDLH